MSKDNTCEKIEKWIDCKRHITMMHFFKKLNKLSKLKIYEPTLRCSYYYFWRSIFKEWDTGYTYIDNCGNLCLIYDTYYDNKNIQDIKEFLNDYNADVEIEHVEIKDYYIRPYAVSKSKCMNIHRTNCYLIRFSDKTYFGKCYLLRKTAFSDDILRVIENYL
jgi:hypothetical protein